MKLEDLKELDESDLRYQLVRFSEHDTICVLDEMIPIPVDAVSFSYDGDEDIEVYDENNDFLGFLCICKTFEDIDTISITDARYIAYINEVDKEFFGYPYKFTSNYLVINISRYEDYKNNYMESAPFWGGFFHETGISSLHGAYKFKSQKLTAQSNINLPTSYHQESCIRSVVQPYAFERFLKLYHLLELIFDWNLVEKIRNLNNDLQGIGQLLNQYSNNKELDRLNKLLAAKHDEGKLDVDKISTCLNRINSPEYLAKGLIIFFDYSKDSNPWNDNYTSLTDLMAKGGFSRTNTKENDSTIKGISNKNYEEFIIKFAAYCIYRVRCCTAHNRIGEYVMSNVDEEFVVEFAEPLLRLILCQIFS